MDTVLTRAEQNFRAIAENSPDSILVVTGDKGIIVYCNPQTAALSGYSAEELLLRSFTEFIHPREFSRLMQNYASRIEGKIFPTRYDAKVVDNDGRIIPVEIRAQRITWQGQPADMIVMRDISQRKKLEELSNSYLNILESVGECVTITDPEGRIVFISQSWAEAAGFAKEAFIGHNNYEFFAPGFREAAMKVFNQVFIQGKPWQGEASVIYPDGREMIGWVHVSPLFDENRKIIGSIGVTVDIKERKSLTKQLDEQLEMLNEFQTSFITAREKLRKLTESVAVVGYPIQALKPALQMPKGRLSKKIGKNFVKISKEANLEVYCFGVLNVCSPFKKIQVWQNLKAKTIFEYLIAKRRAPVSREILMETLWPDQSYKAAINNLKTSIYDLRHVLSRLFEDAGYPCILFSQGGYQINPEIELTVDIEEFEKLWADGKQLERDGNVESAIDDFGKAEALYRGDYLEDKLYEEWTISRRRALKDIYLLIIRKLAEYSMRLYDYESCITYCHKVLARDACGEDSYRRLMYCYSRLGQKHNALRWYETCLRTLKSELNSSPAQETIDLYHSLAKGFSI